MVRSWTEIGTNTAQHNTVFDTKLSLWVNMRYILTPRVNVAWGKLEFLCGCMLAEFCDLDDGKT